MKHAQKLHLDALRHLADLVEEDGASFRGLKSARLGPDGAGERPPLVAEQLGLEQRLGKRAAIHRHERRVRPEARRVDRLREHLLPGPALPKQQHVGVGRRDPLREAPRLGHRGAGADDRVEAVNVNLLLEALDPALQHGRFLPQLPGLQHLLHPKRQLLEDVVLHDVIGGAVFHHLDGLAGVGERGHQDHVGGRDLRPRLAEDLRPVRPRHPHVGNHEVERTGPDLVDGRVAAQGDGDLVPRLGERGLDESTEVFLIFSDQDAIGHGSGSLERNTDFEQRAARRRVPNCNRSAVLGDDSIHEGEPQAGPLGPCGEEGVEDLLPEIARHPGPRVLELDAHLAPPLEDADREAAPVWHHVPRVQSQVQEHVMHGERVAGERDPVLPLPFDAGRDVGPVEFHAKDAERSLQHGPSSNS